MHRKYFALCLVAALTFPSRAAFQFININSQVTSQTTNIPPLNTIAFNETNSATGSGGDTFVMVGSSSNLIVAHYTVNGTNGISWTARTVPANQTNDILSAATFGQDRFVVGGSNAVIFFSTNKGTKWTRSSDAFVPAAQVQGLAFNPNISRFAAVSSFLQISFASNSLVWTNGKLPSPKLESFRGVAPVSFNETNGFVACGLDSVIRESLDGTNWNVVRTNQIPGTNFMGVASDGGMRVIVVGTNGTGVLSTNGEVFSNVSVTNSTSTNSAFDNYNGVTYTGVPGSEFVAVGTTRTASGVTNSVMISSDGAHWTNSLSSPANATNLLAVGFARSGSMQGVGFVVDDQKNIFLFGTPPPAPDLVTNATNCAFLPATNVLAVGIVSNADYPGTLIANWYDSPTGTNQVATNTLTFMPTNTVSSSSNTAVDYNYYVETVDARTTLHSFPTTNRVQVTLHINPRPLAPTNAIWGTNCAFSPTNTPTLQVSSNTMGIAEGQVIVNWYDASTNGNLVLSNSLTFQPTNDISPGPGNTAIDYVYWAEAEVSNSICSCQDCISTNRTKVVLHIDPRPLAPTNAIWGTNCAFSSANTPILSVSANTLGIVEGQVIVNWFDAPTNGNLVLSNSLTFQPINDILPGPGNTATDYVYWTEARVLNANCSCQDCVSTNRTQVVLHIDPRPLAPTNAVSGTNCAFSPGSTPTLSVSSNTMGIVEGPVIVNWYDASTNGNLVLSNSLTLIPTNTLSGQGNTAVDYVYWAEAQVLNTNCSCQNCVSTNRTAVTLHIDPRPLAPTNAVSGTNCAFSPGSTPTLSVSSNTMGIVEGPVIVNWYDAQIAGNLVLSNSLSFVPTNTLPGPGNTATDYVYWAEAQVLNTNCSCKNCIGTSRTAVTLHIDPRPLAPTNAVSATNCAFAAENPTLSVSSNTLGIVEGPVIVNWYDASVGGNLLTNNSLTFTPTNTLPGANGTSTNYIFWTEAQVMNTNCSCQNCVSTNRTQVVLQINPLPPPPMAVSQFVTNCAGITNPALAVMVTNGATADWFDATMTVEVQSNSLTYTPNYAVPGFYTNFAQAIFTNGGCPSATMTPVVILEQACTNEISSITLNNGTNAIIQWYGNYVLQSTTNLAPPTYWTNLTQGGVGITNFWTNSTLPPPTNTFFRLYGPTN